MLLFKLQISLENLILIKASIPTNEAFVLVYTFRVLLKLILYIILLYTPILEALLYMKLD